MPAWSPEVRLLLSPPRTLRALVAERTGGTWTLLRRPLLLAFVLGCTVSLQASGRLSARLIADGLVSFAFVPLFEALALGIIYRLRSPRVTFAQAVDVFFAANAPWLLWLLAFDLLRAVQTPMQATAIPPALRWTLAGSLLPMAAWSLYIDAWFFRAVVPRRGGHARWDLVLERAISWTCIVGYFLGIAIWAQVAAWIGL